jgi:plasmid stabilization system protein ParE
VSTFRFSKRALDDLDSIAAYTIETWGEVQAERYVDQLESAVQRLVEIATLGRRCGHIRPGLWRIEEGATSSFAASFTIGCCRTGKPSTTNSATGGANGQEATIAVTSAGAAPSAQRALGRRPSRHPSAARATEPLRRRNALDKVVESRPHVGRIALAGRSERRSGDFHHRGLQRVDLDRA